MAKYGYGYRSDMDLSMTFSIVSQRLLKSHFDENLSKILLQSLGTKEYENCRNDRSTNYVYMYVYILLK